MYSHVRVPSAWRRRLTLLGVAALVATPLLGVPAAYAAPVATVTFTGGCGLLDSSPTPDVSELNVRIGGEVRFVNQLERDAVLGVNEELAGEVPMGHAVDLTFHKGPLTVTMQINCLLQERSGSVTVNVFAEPPALPAGASGSSAPHLYPYPIGSPSMDPGGAGADPGRSGPSDDLGKSGAAPGRSAGDGPPEPTAGASPAAPGATSSATTPPGEGQEREPAADRSSGSASPDLEAVGRPSITLRPVPADPAALARTARSDAEDRSIGLLALIATVCVVGVSAGAIRTVLAQRAHPPPHG